MFEIETKEGLQLLVMAKKWVAEPDLANQDH
jgi:hypothetical protein